MCVCVYLCMCVCLTPGGKSIETERIVRVLFVCLSKIYDHSVLSSNPTSYHPSICLSRLSSSQVLTYQHTHTRTHV